MVVIYECNKCGLISKDRKKFFFYGNRNNIDCLCLECKEEYVKQSEQLSDKYEKDKEELNNKYKIINNLW